MKPRINIITLGVENLARSIKFYQEGLEFPKLDFEGDIAFFYAKRQLACLIPLGIISTRCQG